MNINALLITDYIIWYTETALTWTHFRKQAEDIPSNVQGTKLHTSHGILK